MKAVFQQMKAMARRIADQHGLPAFYRDLSPELRLSARIFDTNPLVRQIKQIAHALLRDNLGHGISHAEKVAVEAGALMAFQARPLKPAETEADDDRLIRQVVLAHTAGLLHDVKRKEQNHAVAGSVYVKATLRRFSFSPGEIEDIRLAVLNHEAFTKTAPIDTAEGRLLSGCLYDADKFRWGPDNFTHTLWDMLAVMETPVSELLHRFPEGMAGIYRIRGTFRTKAGKTYGPEFIDLGLSIGRALYAELLIELGWDG